MTGPFGYAVRKRNLARQPHVFINDTKEIQKMDKDRIKGMGNQAKGEVKSATGKVLGDTKLRAEGEADKLKGKVQSAVGGAKDAIRRVEKEEDKD
jgi:uncharacterized protein YjbJ (UPF0337 family)